ncbi:MAG: putative electron transport protein YccM [Syntrophorhabdus sp. PtaU1.Bin058]|nr:MAG: putative electron transport protein YccM [Syntrophorhabdus sp. PtaU1.Bin058]
MAGYLPLRKIILLIVIIVIVIGLSILSGRIWGGKSEQSQRPGELIIEKGMTVGRFGQANALSNKVLKEIFDLKTKADLEKPLSEYGTVDQVTSMVKKRLALAAEHESKNWIKIPAKFLLWFVFLSMVFILAKKRRVTSGARKGLLFAAVLIFGVIMGSDPSPMGTVKDAIHLYGTAHAVFPPRMIALTVFLAIVFFANKYICAWGCQAGTLQDLIFRINQTDGQKAVMGRQIKIPFVVTNSIRFIFFCVFTFVAFSLGTDIVEPVDPFKIYNPAHLGLTGGIFIGALLLASLFTYRPWCHLFCPFGLVGWLVEKISLVKISVNYETCIACQRCAAACPSTVMGAILKRHKKTIPDCFACYTCREVCPTGSIQFSTRKRTLPPPGHFDKKKKDGGQP